MKHGYSIPTAGGDLKFSGAQKDETYPIRVTGRGRWWCRAAPLRHGRYHRIREEKQAFILNSLLRWKLLAPDITRVVCGGDKFTYLGAGSGCSCGPRRASAAFKDGVLTLSVPPGGSAKTQFIRWAAREARAVFAQRLAASAAEFSGADGLFVSAKRMLSRWGSINPSKGRLSLSVHLMRCEMDLIDYVIAHELCHIGCMKHNARFYRALESHWPQRREMDRRLAAYGLVDF